MMNQVQTFVLASVTGVLSTALFSSPAAHAQSCAALAAVDGNGTQVEKSVSPPGTGVTRDNWSTDFTIPSNQSFQRYVARIVPVNGGEYRVLMALKYNNDTSNTVFDRTVQLPERRAYNVQGTARANTIPYQVNVQVGGIRAIGNTYTVSAFGCN